MTVTDPMDSWRSLSRKVFKRSRRFVPGPVKRLAFEHWIEPAFRRMLWTRSAMWQGSHVSLIRSLTDCLTLSAYHGPAVSRAFAEVDLLSCVTTDVRPAIGGRLLGRRVIYPDSNPAPPVSRRRAKLCHPSLFLGLVSELGIPIEE
jgi:hypothetical protein